jgi:peptidoglycan hydrolase-like protein with peptidoglycan-binding domain
MATITGGKFRDLRNGSLATVRIAAPVVKQYEFATRNGKDGYVCLGVVGNRVHLLARTPGDHTWYSKHTTVRKPGGPTLYPKRGFIYAGDWAVPEPAKFERWLLVRLRNGVYTDLIKYFNIGNRHWNRKAIRGGKMFAYAVRNPDHHLHLSWMPGAEYAIVDLFGDYEHYRQTGKNRAPAGSAVKPTPRAVTKARPMDAAVAKLPVMREGRKGGPVRVAQACLVAWEVLPRTDRSRAHIDGDFNRATALAVRQFQTKAGLVPSGVVDTRTWKALTPDRVATVIRGSQGASVWFLQCLLLARGFDPGRLDGDAGDATINALKRFQVSAKVRNSVMAGRGDGIAGTSTWVALVTF